MKNEIQNFDVSQKPTIVQKGEKSFYVENQNGASLAINVNILAINSKGRRVPFSTELDTSHFNLIVTPEDIFEQDFVTIRKNHSLLEATISDDAYKRYANLSPEAIDKIKKFPTLICMENSGFNGYTSPDQYAIYAIILNIALVGEDVKIHFHPLNYVSQQKINEFNFNFGIDVSCAITDLNRNEWTIKDINFIEACQKSGISIFAPTN